AVEATAEATAEVADQAAETTAEAAEEVATETAAATEEAADAAADTAETAAAETADATDAAATETSAEVEALAEETGMTVASITELLTVDGFDFDQVIELIDASDIGVIQKGALKAGIEGARNNPDQLSTLLEQVRQALGLEG
ncbi:MAG: translation initiation factor 3, partial [Pseudooceanicola atlanticus]